jgi:arsenite-transporting ATPase
MELMSALFYVEEWHKEKKYDVVIMDTAPTADTLRLLAFPDTANWYFDKLFGMVRNVLKLARATVGKIMSTPLPSDKFLQDLESLRLRLGYVRDILTDPEITSVRLVLNPERMVITETQRAYTYLCLYGYTVEALVINRVLSKDISDSFFDAKFVEQAAHLQTIVEAFSPLKMLQAELMPREIVGRKALDKLADQLFGKEDPSMIYSKESPMKMYDEENGISVLAIKMPFELNQKVELYTRKDDLVLQLGAFKKSITLPHAMANKKVLGADLENGWLKVRFEGENVPTNKGRRRHGSRKTPRKAS